MQGCFHQIVFCIEMIHCATFCDPYYMYIRWNIPVSDVNKNALFCMLCCVHFFDKFRSLFFIQILSLDIHILSKSIHELSKHTHILSNVIHTLSKFIHILSKSIHILSKSIHELSKYTHMLSKNIHIVSKSIHELSKDIHISSKNIHESITSNIEYASARNLLDYET